MTYIDVHAVVSENAVLGAGTAVWAFTQIREGAVIGSDTSIGSHAYVDAGVHVGSNCKIQSGALLFSGSIIEDGVFVGPGVIVTNDRRPRAVNADLTKKGSGDWDLADTVVRTGASLGAGSVLIAGIEVGAFAMVGAGAVVTGDVAAHALVVGVPARRVGWVCACGEQLEVVDGSGECPSCHREFQISSP